MATPRPSSDELLARLRTVCFGFPAVEEKLSHGAPVFHVRGKLFVTFADDHHGDGRVGAWCKVPRERQQELIGEAPERFFVPPYVGVKGWVGVHLDHPAMDWEELAILAEEGWLSVAPKSVRLDPVAPPPPAAPRPRTDPAVAARVLERLEAITGDLAEVASEREKWSATFRVNKKPFVYFVDNHHGDGVVGMWVKAAPGDNAALAASDPERFFVPPYLGPRGWLGVRLDREPVDWDDAAARVAASYAATAPKRLLRGPR